MYRHNKELKNIGLSHYQEGSQLQVISLFPEIPKHFSGNRFISTSKAVSVEGTHEFKKKGRKINSFLSHSLNKNNIYYALTTPIQIQYTQNLKGD